MNLSSASHLLIGGDWVAVREVCVDGDWIYATGVNSAYCYAVQKTQLQAWKEPMVKSSPGPKIEQFNPFDQ